MSYFRKKPVVIEAVEWEPEAAPTTYPQWFWDVFGMRPELLDQDSGVLTIPTLEGDHRCQPGDWIIRGIKGELYPCKPDIFVATYEPATSGLRERAPQSTEDGE